MAKKRPYKDPVMETIIPITDHIVFETMLNALHVVVRSIPPCGCGRFYTDRKLVDPTCHRHAWLEDIEIQMLYFAHDQARRLKEQAQE